jgi:hypothetical protein
MADFLPKLPESWEPTRATLHAYAHGVGAIPQAAGVFHPKWWHISLKVRPTGLTTDAVALPDGGTLQVRMDLVHHEVVVETSHGDRSTVPLGAGLTGTEMGDRLIAAVADYGVTGDYARGKFENDEAREYDPQHATTFWSALVNINQTFERHRSSLEGAVGPLQVWPHGFDLAFEWFGTRVEEYEEDGETSQHPSQLNLGFYPAGRAYFYSNPWPFESDALTGVELPHGAEWHTEGWEGSVLYYDQLAGDATAAQKLLDYAAAVHAAAAPTLTV